MSFKPEKCSIIQSTRKRCPTHVTYLLSGHKLFETHHYKYLGVTLPSDMKRNQHIDIVTAKANSVIRFLRRNLSNSPAHVVKTQAFKSLGRTHLEYCSYAWVPHTRKHIYKIEVVQHRVVHAITQDDSWTSSTTAMLKRLKLPLLKQRRRYSSLVTLHKIIHHSVDLSIRDLRDLQEPPSSRMRMNTRSY